jgi:hypothetical protein
MFEYWKLKCLNIENWKLKCLNTENENVWILKLKIEMFEY